MGTAIDNRHRSLLSSNQSSLTKDHRVQGLFVREWRTSLSRPDMGSILMIHGGCHGWWAFEKWGPSFAEKGWPAFALSLRNHSDSYTISPQAFLDLTLGGYVDDVLKIIEWMETPLILLGHSMGGLIAQKVAEKVRVQALVLVSSVGPGQLGKMRNPYPADKPITVDAESARATWFHDIDEEEFRGIAERLVPESPSVVNEYSGGYVRVDPQLVACPVLVTGGDEDRSTVHKPLAVAKFYGAELITFPGCGHDLMLERKSLKAADSVNSWLKSKVRRQVELEQSW